MGYWVYLHDRTDPDDVHPVKVDSHEEGGTYVAGGTDEACVSVTTNYTRHFVDALGGESLREFLQDRKAADAIPGLEAGVGKLGTERGDDYWTPTPGNAGAVLALLLRWARQHPEAVFYVSG
jgi:hypothetical protein